MIRRFPIILFICLLGCDVANALLQKTASNRADGEGWSYIYSLVNHPWMWLALSIGPIQLWIWPKILSKADISLALPLTSLSYPLTLIAAVCFLGESLRWQAWLGACMITVGSIILGLHKNASASDQASEPRNNHVHNHPVGGVEVIVDNEFLH